MSFAEDILGTNLEVKKAAMRSSVEGIINRFILQNPLSVQIRLSDNFLYEITLNHDFTIRSYRLCVFLIHLPVSAGNRRTKHQLGGYL